MSALDKKRRGELLQATLGVLADHPDGIQAKDAIAGVEHRLQLTDHEKGSYSGSNVRRFEKIVRFVTIGPVKAGWMVKEAGIWSPTEEGVAAHQKFTDPEQLLNESDKLYKAWEKAQPPKEPDEEDEAATVISDASVTLEKAEEDSWEEVREFLAAMDPYEFQHLVAGLLRGMGYHVAWVSPPGKDRGVDIIALTDPLGTKGPRIKVQVKRQKDKTDSKNLRAFMSVLKEQDVGTFVSLGGFTSDAEEEARNEARRIRLIGAFQLYNLWTRYYDQIPEQDRRRLPVKFVPFLATGEQEP